MGSCVLNDWFDIELDRVNEVNGKMGAELEMDTETIGSEMVAEMGTEMGTEMENGSRNGNGNEKW